MRERPSTALPSLLAIRERWMLRLEPFSPSAVPMFVWQRVQNVPIVPLVRSISVRLNASKIGLCWA